MHTLIVITIGFVLLVVGVFVGHVAAGASGAATAAIVFLPLWAIGAAINLYIGVKGAGYTLKEETPVFLLVFAVPAAVALIVWTRFR